MNKYKLFIYKYTIIRYNKRTKSAKRIYDLLLDEPLTGYIKDFDPDNWIELIEA